MAVRALSAVLGAVGFLTRVPVGRSEAEWEAFRRTPAAVPVVGYLVGVAVAAAVLVPAALLGAPAPAVALGLLVAVYGVTGITHVDGVADLGDAAAVHGSPADRRAVLKDTTVGTGGVLAVAVVVAGLALAGLALADLPLGVAAAVVVAGEVGAKGALAALVCVGDAPHEGLGSALTTESTPRDALGVAAVAAPAAVLAWPTVAVGAAVLAAAAVVAALVFRWANRRVGGVNGDVLGATNELARVAALHAGVIAWTLS